MNDDQIATADAFLATVQTYDPATGAIVQPLMFEFDGTPHLPVTAFPTGGITPGPGDIVLVVTIRNASDNLPISRYFGASESNGRIIDVVVPASGKRVLTGNYQFIGPIEIQGSLSVTGPVTVTGDTTLTGALTVSDKLTVGGDVDIAGNSNLAGNLSVVGTSTLGGIVFASHKHISAGQGNPTGPAIP